VTDVVDELIAHCVRVDSVEEVAGLPPDTESVFLGVLTDELAFALARLPQLRPSRIRATPASRTRAQVRWPTSPLLKCSASSGPRRFQTWRW
jgi:hypothetical protein